MASRRGSFKRALVDDLIGVQPTAEQITLRDELPGMVSGTSEQVSSDDLEGKSSSDLRTIHPTDDGENKSPVMRQALAISPAIKHFTLLEAKDKVLLKSQSVADNLQRARSNTTLDLGCFPRFKRPKSISATSTVKYWKKGSRKAPPRESVPKHI